MRQDINERLRISDVIKGKGDDESKLKRPTATERFSLDYQESYPSTVLFKNCHGIALFMDELLSIEEASFGSANQAPVLGKASLVPLNTSKAMTSDLVAYWDVPLNNGVHRIEFEHGTTTGKRVIRVDGEVILKRDWMFKLVGSEVFNVGKAKCVIRIDPVGGFSYSYSLTVNGKNFNTFAEIQSKVLKTWLVHFDDDTYRVVLEKDTLDIWANGEKLDVAGEFVENGTETHFTLGEWPACIKAVTSGNRREGIIHHLIVNDKIVPERVE